MTEKAYTIDVRPPVSVYATYQRLNYLPWYAIAEFVDNSTQNYFDHRTELKESFNTNGESCLRISIEYDNEKNLLVIADNANGMDIEELTRAVVLDSPPPNKNGRSEYGMGLKTAACWFGKNWSIDTKRLGAKEKYKVCVNIQDFVDKKTEILPIHVEPANQSQHYTIIKIEDLHKPLRTRTHQRIKDQLSSIYRQDLRSGEVKILWNNIPLQFQNPSILTDKEDDGTIINWRKNIKFDVKWDAGKSNLGVHGWVGIMNPGRQRDAGFVLLRRGRVIIGGPDVGYKPIEIFGQPNSFRSQRLIGELNMDDWPVTQSKDSFDWSGGLEDDFIFNLREVCKEYMDKAEGYRQTKKPPTEHEMKEAAQPIEKMFEDKKFSNSIATEIACPIPRKTYEQEKEDIKKLESVSKGPIIFKLPLRNVEWTFRLHWQDQYTDAQWMSLEYPQDTQIDIYLNSMHPFFVPYLENKSMLELLQKFVIAIALAETLARQTSGNSLIDPADFRVNMNRVLRYASEIREE